VDNDIPRLATTGTDSDFMLSIDEALERYTKAGLPRIPRSVQRYCAKGHLQCRLIETTFGEKYLITPDSVDKHIAYINEVTPTTVRDLSRPVATTSVGKNPETVERQPATEVPTSPDVSRPVAAELPAESRYVARLEGENEFLRRQVDVKDNQIKDLTERARETNHLIGGLQRMLSPLLGKGERRDNSGAGEGASEISAA
jgi:hypothetical protein